MAKLNQLNAALMLSLVMLASASATLAEAILEPEIQTLMSLADGVNEDKDTFVARLDAAFPGGTDIRLPDDDTYENVPAGDWVVTRTFNGGTSDQLNEPSSVRCIHLGSASVAATSYEGSLFGNDRNTLRLAVLNYLMFIAPLAGDLKSPDDDSKVLNRTAGVLVCSVEYRPAEEEPVDPTEIEAFLKQSFGVVKLDELDAISPGSWILSARVGPRFPDYWIESFSANSNLYLDPALPGPVRSFAFLSLTPLVSG
jgi:hypothetical protein